MATEITMPDKDDQRITRMAIAIAAEPGRAGELLRFAYGLGYCQGRVVTAKEMVAIIDDSASPATERSKSNG